MLETFVKQGQEAALRVFGLAKVAEVPLPTPAPAPTAGVASRASGFLGGQLGAAKDLFSNLRGGLGGQMNPDVLAHPDPGVMRSAHRARAIGNLKTLAPTLAAGGGLYLLHRHNQAQQEEEARQRAMMGGYPAAM